MGDQIDRPFLFLKGTLFLKYTSPDARSVSEYLKLLHDFRCQSAGRESHLRHQMMQLRSKNYSIFNLWSLILILFLFHRHTLGQISGLIHITTPQYRNMIGQ